jgi:patatin-like phospholipase/acyl hydrolase
MCYAGFFLNGVRPMSNYHILSLDGGGIRGIITAAILRRLNTHPEITDFLEGVDLIAGTSTGGIIALALAKGASPDDLVQLYKKLGPAVFADSLWDNIKDLGTFIGAQYDTEPLENQLKDFLGKSTSLGQLHKSVLITAFDLDNLRPEPEKRTWKPKLFHNMGEASDADALAFKVGLYTSAAPTYFPSVDGYIDGGIYANNPSMCALAQTQDERVFKECPNISDIVLLSLGTGTSLKHLEGMNLDWGLLQWARPLISILLDGVSGIADFQCQKMLRENYFRLAPEFPPGVTIDMDEVAEISLMLDFANEINIDETVQWIKKHWLNAETDPLLEN